MKFYVPTYNRPISDFIEAKLTKFGRVVLVVRKEQEKSYREQYGRSVEYLTLPKVSNIAETRAAMCALINDAVWAMVDDDITGFIYKTRGCNVFGGLAAAPLYYVERVLSGIEDKLRLVSGVAAIGIPDRVTLSRPNKGAAAGPLRQFVVLNRAAAKVARYGLPILSDIQVTLQWLSMPHEFVYNHGILGQTSPPTNKKKSQGGCGEYREKNTDYYAKNYLQLQKLYPDIVKVKVEDGEVKKTIRWSLLRNKK